MIGARSSKSLDSVSLTPPTDRAELANDGICARDSVGQGLNGALMEEVPLLKSLVG